MEIVGKLHVKYDAQQVTASFTKREFVLMIADNPQYPQYVVFQLTQEKCGFLDSFVPGSDVKVFFNLRGREWKSPQGEIKYFNTLEAWSIMPAVAAGSTTANNAAPTVPQVDVPKSGVDVTQLDDSDDLPF
ncbi:MAG: DUF3127 domain-containing protein [Bacteroidia bacterium]